MGQRHSPVENMVTWQGQRVLVTGANGFLGSILVSRLIETGALITCLIKEDRPCSQFQFDNLASRVACIRGGIEDFELLCHILAEESINCFFHLAARPIVKEAMEDPLPALETNIRGTYCLLEAARCWGRIKSFVVVTSDKVYGESEKLPSTEVDHLRGIAPYDASKVCADVLAQSYARTFNMPIGIARLANLYGPSDTQWSRIVPGTARSIFLGQRPIIRSNGSMKRDYLFVDDAVRGLLALGDTLIERPQLRGETFNFGTGIATSVSDIVVALLRASHTKLDPIILDHAPSEISAQCLDSQKAKRVLGWQSDVELSHGLDLAWTGYERLFREHPEALT